MKPASTGSAEPQLGNNDTSRIADASAHYRVERQLLDVPPGYKRTEVGVIPEDWEVRALKSLGQFKNGINKGKEEFGYGFPFVNLMDVFGIPKVSKEDSDFGFVNSSPSEREAYTLRRGDVLFVRSSVKPEGVGLTTLIAEDLPDTVFSGFLIRYRDNGDLVHEFKEHCFWEESFRNRLLASSTVSANTNINQEALKSLWVVFSPNRTEQRAIAEALSDVDGLLRCLEALIAKKQAIKQAAMQQLLTGNTRLPGFSGPWETKRLGEVAELHRQNIVPAAVGEALFTHFSLPAFDDGQAPVIEAGNAIGSNKFRVPASAVLVSKLNPRIPRVWMPHEGVPNAVASTEFLVLTPRQGTSRIFLFVLCSSPKFCDQLELSATGTTGSHQRVNPSDAMKISLRVPPNPAEQTAIATVLTDMDAEIAALERRRDKTRAIKQGMMQQLLTGRVRLVKPEAPSKQSEAGSETTKAHSWAFNEAVVIATLAKHFGKEAFPLGRKRYTKLSYLLHRHAERQVDGYLKKAAGPYNPKTKYGGPERIALESNYVREHKNGPYTGFVAADNVDQAEGYFQKWYGPEAIQWLEQFRFKNNDELELLATVDMAYEELRAGGKDVDAPGVKTVIRGHPEWKAKLDREIFSDVNIAAAIKTIRKLFGREGG